jgi:hypothetical protein
MAIKTAIVGIVGLLGAGMAAGRTDAAAIQPVPVGVEAVLDMLAINFYTELFA